MLLLVALTAALLFKVGLLIKASHNSKNAKKEAFAQKNSLQVLCERVMDIIILPHVRLVGARGSWPGAHSAAVRQFQF